MWTVVQSVPFYYHFWTMHPLSRVSMILSQARNIIATYLWEFNAVASGGDDTIACIKGIEIENLNDNHALRSGRASGIYAKVDRWELAREYLEMRMSKKDRKRPGKGCRVLKGDIPWMIFYSWPSALLRLLPLTSSRSSRSRWCRSRGTAVSSASKRGSKPGLMDFTTPQGPLNPHSLLTPDLTVVPTSVRFTAHAFTRTRSRTAA